MSRIGKLPIAVPSGVDVQIDGRTVTVKGPKGKPLTRDFKHLKVDMAVIGKKQKKVAVTVYFGTREQIASIRTCLSHIENMITGVTKGYEYKMRLVYAHFPINVAIVKDGKEVEIRNFLGEKIVRTVTMLDGVKIDRSANVKDELVLVGNDVELVSRSAALIHQSVLVKNKDIRKFLDGIYVSEKHVIGQD